MTFFIERGVTKILEVDMKQLLELLHYKKKPRIKPNASVSVSTKKPEAASHRAGAGVHGALTGALEAAGCARM